MGKKAHGRIFHTHPKKRYSAGADTPHAPTTTKSMFLEAVLCSTEKDKSENAPLKSWYMTLLINLSTSSEQKVSLYNPVKTIAQPFTVNP